MDAQLHKALMCWHNMAQQDGTYVSKKSPTGPTFHGPPNLSIE